MKTISKNLTDSISLPSRRRAFTLIELLVVISIIGVIAGLTLGVAKAVGKTRKIAVAKGELAQIQIALESYKAKYGVYPPGNEFGEPKLNQLYYELSGTVTNGLNYVTLDGSANIPIVSVPKAYKVGGFLNCSKGGGEDRAAAENFLRHGLRSQQVYYPVTNNSGNFNVPTTILVTSVGGPDDNYLPLNATGLNPIRYLYPGTNNPSGYDLWVQLQINNTKYLICNWSKSAQVNTSYP